MQVHNEWSWEVHEYTETMVVTHASQRAGACDVRCNNRKWRLWHPREVVKWRLRIVSRDRSGLVIRAGSWISWRSSTLSSARSLLTLDKDQGNPMVTLHHIYHTHTLWNKRKYSDFPLNTRPVWYAREKDGREWCWWWSSPGKSLKRNAGLSAFSTTDGGKKGKEKLIPHWKKTQAYMKWTPLTPDAFQFYTIALYQLSSFQIELTSLSLSLPPPTPLFLWKYGS